jgi:hypothetical protein
MKTLFKFIFLNSIVFCLLIPLSSFAGVDLPWSTTFNCQEWVCCGTLNCDDLKIGGGWACGGTTYERITSDANFSGGGGGKGQRHWEGDGINVNSGGFRISFNSPQPELWVRWYMRYEGGFTWLSLDYDKWLYFHSNGSSAPVPEFSNSLHEMRIANQGGTGGWPLTQIFGWQDIMGGTTSDGLFHCYEIHMKMDTDSTDGIGEIWVDSVSRISKSDVDWSGGDAASRQGWVDVLIGSNQREPNNGRCMYVDFDDIAISNTGYIGPLGGDKPKPPTGLKIVQ